MQVLTFFNIAAPNCRTIVKTVDKFSTMRTVCNVNKGHSGRRGSSRSVEHVDAIRESVLWSPRKSIRRLLQKTSIPRSSVHHILRADLHLFPFKIDHQKTKILEIAQWFSGRLETDDTFLRKLHMTDECHVHLSGKVNKQNF